MNMPSIFLGFEDTTGDNLGQVLPSSSTFSSLCHSLSTCSEPFIKTAVLLAEAWGCVARARGLL